jgi:O-acetyl-ADP-ribose deacetylase
VISFQRLSLAIEIMDGDIAAQQVDAVVNAANDHLWMGAGVAGALKARGGAGIEAEAIAQGPIAPGECVVTSGGALPARFVIHAAVMGQDLRTSAALIERATRSSLEAAEARRITSMAFPAFGTGVGGYPIEGCARLMVGAARAHTAVSLKLVRFVLFGQPAYRSFAAVACDLLGAPLDGPPDCPISG